MSGTQGVIARAAEPAGSIDAVAVMLSVPADQVARWAYGVEKVPPQVQKRLSRCIAEAERAASRVKPLPQEVTK